MGNEQKFDCEAIYGELLADSKLFKNLSLGLWYNVVVTHFTGKPKFTNNSPRSDTTVSCMELYNVVITQFTQKKQGHETQFCHSLHTIMSSGYDVQTT
jgi:hypothetical protein